MVATGKHGRKIVLWLLCLAAGLSLSGRAAGTPVCPEVTPTIVPAWVDIISNHFNDLGSPGTSFLFSNLERNPRRPGQSLPVNVQTPPGALGTYDAHIFPAGPVFYSNSSGASIECLPGLDPSLIETVPARPPRTEAGCPPGQVGEECAPDGDCTGRRILRTPSSGIESALTSGITGIDYLGTFEGESNAASGAMVQVVFFHQSADYLAQAEYGFLRDLAVPNQITFYWQSNANCTLHADMGPSDTMCTTLQGNRQPATYIYTDDLPPPGNSPPIVAACNIDLGPTGGFGLYYYSMWIFSDGGTLKFGMSILDPDTLMPVVPETSIDPNLGAPSTWFPISALNGTDGYVTAGIARYDPFRTQTFSLPAPSMSIQRLAAGTAP
jgi:hypothetical protein